MVAFWVKTCAVVKNGDLLSCTTSPDKTESIIIQVHTGSLHLI